MSAVFQVILGIAVAVLGMVLVRDRRYGQVLIGVACLSVGAYLAINGFVTIRDLFQ